MTERSIKNIIKVCRPFQSRASFLETQELPMVREEEEYPIPEEETRKNEEPVEELKPQQQ